MTDQKYCRIKEHEEKDWKCGLFVWSNKEYIWCLPSVPELQAHIEFPEWPQCLVMLMRQLGVAPETASGSGHQKDQSHKCWNIGPAQPPQRGTGDWVQSCSQWFNQLCVIMCNHDAPIKISGHWVSVELPRWWTHWHAGRKTWLDSIRRRHRSSVPFPVCPFLLPPDLVLCVSSFGYFWIASRIISYNHSKALSDLCE